VPAYTQPAAPVAPVVQPSGEPDLGELNRCLMRWLMANRRRPASFEDFAATAGTPIPPPRPAKSISFPRTCTSSSLTGK
jgi:hypothetical protein